MGLRRNRLLWVLVALIAFLLFVAVASGIAYLILRQRQEVVGAWQDPIAAVSPDDIAADLAIYPLAGASELETVDAAIANGDLETAHSALVFGLELSDAQRIGRSILLGRRLAEMGEPAKSALVYQMLFDIAVLSPELSDPARADALLAAGKGWADLGHRTQALDAYDQVYLIAVRSPYLQMAHRRELLDELEATYLQLGDEEQALAARQRIIELDQETQPKPPVQPIVAPELPEGAAAVSSPEIGALEEARRQAAYVVLQELSGGGEASAESVNGLAQALQAEDAAKMALYRQELESATQLGQRIEVHWQLIRWLMLKYRVAMRAFGLSLIPEWEAQAAEIQSSLSKAYEDLYFDYEDLVAALPDASLIAPGTYEVRRRVILAGRLGHYANYPAQPLAGKLQDAVGNLIAAGHLEELYVDVAGEDEGLHFFLSPADLYGLPNDS
jgi:hypothetical protein